MAEWDRKQLVKLVDDIRGLLACDALPPSLRAQLQATYEVARNHSKLVAANASDVGRVRKELSVCLQDPFWRDATMNGRIDSFL